MKPALVPPFPVPANRELVDAAFAKHFPEWNTLSPFDPVKLVAEGLVGALASVEQRQRKMLESALDAMPALFGFEPKTAKLPVALFRLKSPERAKLPVALEGKPAPKYPPYVLFPVANTEVSPLTLRSQKQAGTVYELAVDTRAALPELVLTYLPREGAPARLLDLRIGTSTLKDFAVRNETGSFAHYGALRIRRRDGAPVAASGQTLEVTLETDVPPAGALTVNVVPFAFGKKVEELSLGTLEGDPWESVALPEGFVGIPERLVLRFPDGRRHELPRIAEEALRRTDLEAGFLYDGLRHRVVLPGADALVGDWNGGVEALVPQAVLLPEVPFLPGDVQPALGEASAFLEAIEPVAPLTPAVPRESQAAFLERFYGSMRRLPARAPGLPAEEIAQAILTAVPELRAVELREGTAFCRGEEPHRLDAAVVARVRRILEEALPLGVPAAVVPFERKPVAVTAHVKLRLDDVAMATLDRPAYEKRVEKELGDLLLAVGPGESRSAKELEGLLGRRLGQEVRLVLRAGEAFQEVLTRKAGEAFDLELTTTLELGGLR